MPSVSRSGLMTIEGFLARTGTVTEANDMVLWVGPPGALVPVVREGDMIDLMPCFGAGSAVLNDSGQLAALSALGTANTAAVLHIENSNKVLVALARQRGPGMGANDLWQGQSQSTFSAPLINAQGDVLFSGSIWNPGAFPVYQSGLWIYDGEVSLVTRSGYSINGLPQAVSQILGDFGVNAAGDVVFRASLDPIVQTAGLFHWSSETGVSPIVMVGSVIELAPGVTKIVSGIQWASGSGGQDGRPTGLSDNGFLAFLVFFTDSTGAVIVANVQSGACCHPSGTCVASIRSGCAAGSIWAQGGLCTPSSCVPAVGACCVSTSCSVGDFAACSGTFQGPGTTCGDALNPTTCCPANFNGTGGVGVQDIFDFLAAYFSGNPAADFNSTGDLTVQDIFELLAAFFAGCD